MTTNWTKESLQTEVDSKAEVYAALALAEKHERERLVWIEFATALANRSVSCSGPEVARLADDLTRAYNERWEE